jgi:hypothetical protein
MAASKLLSEEVEAEELSPLRRQQGPPTRRNMPCAGGVERRTRQGEHLQGGGMRGRRVPRASWQLWPRTPALMAFDLCS